MARGGVDRCEVGVVVGSAFGEGDDVVCLVCAVVSADVADACVPADDASGSSLFGGSGDALVLASFVSLAGPGGGWVVFAWSEVRASGLSAWCCWCVWHVVMVGGCPHGWAVGHGLHVCGLGCGLDTRVMLPERDRGATRSPGPPSQTMG